MRSDTFRVEGNDSCLACFHLRGIKTESLSERRHDLTSAMFKSRCSKPSSCGSSRKPFFQRTLGQETQATRDAYGKGEFADGCLAARRLVERGVRMVQVFYGNGQPWGDHENIADHAQKAKAVDQPIAALIKDLKARGLFEDTLILWGGEFGRTPVSEGAKGRDHNNHGFTVWLAGGGVKGGMVYGATDEFGFAAVENKVHVHDLHATILHLMGIDHEKLTFRYSGRDFRLTDVHGRVVQDILA